MVGKASPRNGSMPGEGRAEGGKGEVALCIRLRPGAHADLCATVDSTDCVRLRACSGAPGLGRYDSYEALYGCDHAFGPEATQELVYAQAVSPIAEAVIRGYNGAVIAYGQTGAGKTHTMIGAKGKAQGMAPRAVSAIFAALARRESWQVEVSVLEIYNERVRDLLAPSGSVGHVDIHEVRSDDQQSQSFRCPDATRWPAKSPEEALTALAEGVRRRETARTDMNHHSSRSHLVFTICVWQSDPEAGVTLRSRLHMVDLAGSERLKRSMASESPRHASGGSLTARQGSRHSPGPSGGSRTARDQRREAVEINRSLSQLALVIQRLTAPGSPQYVPYRDSMLTRLLADSFGGSSRTCLLVACSPLASDREETRSSLDFGRRAKLVRNKPRINMEVDDEPSAVVKALVAREMAMVQVECEALRSERDALLAENARLQAQGAHAEVHAEEVDKLRSQLEMEASEKRDLASRIALLMEENHALRHSSGQAAEDTAKFQGDRAAALAKLEEQVCKQHARWQEDVTRLQQEKASVVRQWVEEKAILHMRLQEVLGDAAQLQDDRASQAAKAQDERFTIFKRWQDEIQAVHEEKAEAVAALEKEKVDIHQRWQEEAAQLREAKAAAVADLEREKACLRRKWQEALEEVRALQGQQVVLEGMLAEEKSTLLAAMEADKAAGQRAAQAELAQVLTEKAAEVARLERERIALQRRLNEDAARSDQDHADSTARLEAEMANLRWKCQEAASEVSSLQQEKAMLASKLEADLALAQQRWKADAADQVQEVQWARSAQTSDLQGQLALSERRCRELEAYSRRLESELIGMKPEAQTWRRQVPSSSSSVDEGPTRCPSELGGSSCSTEARLGPAPSSSPPQWCRAPSVKSVAAEAAPVDTGSGKEDTLPAKSVLEGRSLNWGDYWTPSRSRAEIEPGSEPEAGDGEMVDSCDEVPRRIALDLELAN
uniref:Kinesin-like protein n=1 Tax=Alexandrium monilatum TaxID=311494 RepID=A0A7S4UJI2_9DINO